MFVIPLIRSRTGPDFERQRWAYGSGTAKFRPADFKRISAFRQRGVMKAISVCGLRGNSLPLSRENFDLGPLFLGGTPLQRNLEMVNLFQTVH